MAEKEDLSKKEKVKKAVSKMKIEYLVVIALSVVALIIMLNAFSPSVETATASAIDEYVENLENKLKNCLSKVDGAGKVEVIISVESGMQTVFATETTYANSSQTTTNAPVIVSGKPIVLREEYPEIVGVVIVAEGAKNLAVKVDLLNACEVFLSIPEDKIRVLSMK